MSKSVWGVFAVALGMMAATAGWLNEFRGRHLLGPSGVQVGPVAIYDDSNKLAATNGVILPVKLPGMVSQPLPITTIELTALPKDTTFGRRFYSNSAGDLRVQLSVVLMGTDHTSIHQPQYCLYAQGWNITDTERINVPMKRPFYDIPAIKIVAAQQYKGEEIRCLYVYWFVSGEKVTAEEGSRLWSMWKTMLKKGEMERWAYVSYFTTCLPGREQATFERLTKFIQASAPEFQLVKGAPPGSLEPMAARK